jgi:membrane protein implicated in regulation of membrane protease activity
VVEIQRQLEALRALTLRSTAMLFVFGVPVWFVPFCIVAMRSWFGADLYAWFGAGPLLAGVAGSVALALGLMWLCRRLADRLERSPRLRQAVRGLAGHNLTAAQDQLARLAAFERGD